MQPAWKCFKGAYLQDLGVRWLLRNMSQGLPVLYAVHPQSQEKSKHLENLPFNHALKTKLQSYQQRIVWVVSGEWTGTTKNWRGTCPDKVKLQHWSALASHSKACRTQWLGWSAIQKLLFKTDLEMGRNRGSRTVYPSTVLIGQTRVLSSRQASFQCHENHRPTVY